ncbi:PREDICTED: uncharacterized protein LOC109462795 [Branchiostoma belcheri]|uniref:Uncharacterized protein LOC109462795 n=1 Tax=Branchiostoma belcheri TaxID=7741 RepID=A0A6P4XEK1_BRABE|nr:PREDICTED: uncharacterized protein LOC109462795 [Branchiostoma belcheri]
MRYFLLNILLICPFHPLLVDATVKYCCHEEFLEWIERLVQKNMAGAVCEEENLDLAGELEVLQAIYGEDVQSLGGGAHTEVLMTLGQEGIGLQFLLSGRYPEEPPTIHVSSSEACDVADSAVLGAHLEGVAKASVGEPMLHTLITEAKDFVASRVKDVPRSCSTKTSAQDDSKPVCKFFLEGKCRFGDNCFNRHPQENAVPTAAKRVSLSETKAENRESLVESRESERKGGKKPPMRTALDVINRIQWDDDLPSRNFVIGYLDRFTGVQERPFDEFTWGELSDAELDDLAIPQHRIQYFKYHDQKVWDKNERLDNVFGSTGSYVTIHDVMQRYKKEDETVQEKEEGEGTQDVADPEEPSEDEESSSDEDGDMATNKTRPRKSSKPTSSNKPNYFVAVRITDPDILRVARDFQKCIFERSPVLDAALAPVEKLHVTLCVLRIDDQTQLDAARRVLRDLKRESARLLPPSLVLNFRGVETFHNRVVYAAPEDNANFRALAGRVTSLLGDAGLNMAGNRDEYIPHLTLLKLSKSMCKEMASCGALSAEGVDPTLYDRFVDRQFGAQAVDELHLCSMGSTRHDGFYQCEASVGLFDEH